MEIYAELFKNPKKNDFLDHLPGGVVIKRKNNSRACIFECEDKYAKQLLIDLLESSEVCYQDMDEEKDDQEENEE